MAAVNGDSSHLLSSKESSLHLGKRKRSSSPEKKDFVNGQDAANLQHSLNTILAQSKKSDSILSFLRQKIPTQAAHQPDAKRVRLDSAEPDAASIENRILAGTYQSRQDVLKDINCLRDATTSTSNNGEINGNQPATRSDLPGDVADQLIQLLRAERGDASTCNQAESTAPKHHASQIIMLRSTTDRGVSMLYSGLQSESVENKDLTKGGRRLPNGFDLAEAAPMDANSLAPTKQPRKFGDVFGPHRNTKALEMPRSRTTFRSNTLGFSSDQFPDRPAPMSRQDYKHQQLATGSWLTYAKGHALSEQDASRKYRDKNAATNDFRAALIANDVAVNESNDSLALFKKAFSSFTPETDSSASLIANHDRDRQWWCKYGAKRMRKIFSSAYPEPETSQNSLLDQPVGDDEFADVLSFNPAEEDEEPTPQDEPQNLDEVLDEISQLLETVHSYQRLRSLETRPSADTTKPSSDEFDTYEILRSQLAILIASVPPFAIAKLDGDKLADLNISTNLMVEGVEYRGTLQPDDFTLSKYRAAQQSLGPRMTQTAAPAVRPTYPPQTNVTRYGGANLQNYAHNLGIQAQYAQRQAQQYSTPQNMQRNYQPYQQAGSHSAQPNVQQFQRPTSNGYGNWGNTANNTPHANYAQSPSQPGYQQRAQQQQQQALYAAQTPSRPVTNGQTSYQASPQYQRPPFAAQQQQQSQGVPNMQPGVVNGGQ